VDILHTHNCYADCVGVVAARLTPVKTITTLYVWADLGWKRNLIQRINQFVLRFFDEVTAHCEDTRQRSIERGIPPERLRTLISGFEGERVVLSPEERRRRRRELGTRDDDVVLVNIARLYPEKAQESLLRCFEIIHERCPAARLWIAGVGPLEAHLRAESERLGLASSVSFLGFVRDLPSLLALGDIQVHPATAEGVPLAICAGMAAGLPIVASAVGGLPEIMDGGRNGFLIPPGDQMRFVETVLDVIRDPREARRRSAAAKHFIEHPYSLSAAVGRVEQTYREMLGSCGSASS
jgi:glycosyltransferase involved in cell wall biosynthesis